MYIYIYIYRERDIHLFAQSISGSAGKKRETPGKQWYARRADTKLTRIEPMLEPC